MIQINMKKAYGRVTKEVLKGDMKAAVRHALDADMNMYTLLELHEIAEFENEDIVRLRDLALLGMYLEKERMKRYLVMHQAELRPLSA